MEKKDKMLSCYIVPNVQRDFSSYSMFRNEMIDDWLMMIIKMYLWL